MSDISGKVQTVLGPIDPSELGITVTHEHLLLDITCYTVEAEHATGRAFRDAPITMDMLGDLPSRFLYSLENMRLLDDQTATEEVLRFRHAGGGSVVDTTSANIARDPLAYARISRATGLNVVMGAGYYVSVSLPDDMPDRTADSITEEIVRDLTVGVGDTGVRSGVIGEIGCSLPLHPQEKKSVYASGMAQKETGAPLTLHSPGDWKAKHEVLQVLLEAGANPQKIIFGHSDGFRDRDGLRALAEAGCYIQLDVFGWEDTSLERVMPGVRFTSDAERLEIIADVAEMGFIDRVMVGQDVCQPWQYARNGGKGFSHHLENIVPRMRGLGFTEADLHKIFVENPARAFAFE
jgi:phosphotriesterase-related protein